MFVFWDKQSQKLFSEPQNLRNPKQIYQNKSSINTYGDLDYKIEDHKGNTHNDGYSQPLRKQAKERKYFVNNEVESRNFYSFVVFNKTKK